ncbi:unnamed protein product (macronuclear) [Paramecium tetraurelia]|uniref:Uncharacterized protein n=1 Tax=Paramecium tetraurelia TaxID=5888 RepID=A0C276_PARTE|nr:uncharacterized protein GSPATT00034370001 [Paramecium tetraurelia]CAK64893.1 unnamed protein product [Paramecium tetraurelia]|eukprot:XP_001432290.1 hypothetical protein (macronuclear) [Paramecium tetraurelia strain d4-2]
MIFKMHQAKSTLRGGGCGSFSVIPQKTEHIKSDSYDIQNFIAKFDSYVKIIQTKAAVAANQSESQEIMIAIQWFNFQEEIIYKLSKNAQSVVKSYDLIIEGIRKLLKSCLIYIRTDSFKCLYILQTTASLSKVIFSFHLINGERFMKSELQKEFLDISDELRQQMEIEKNDLIQNQMELYLFLIKTSFEIAPKNRKEKEIVLKGCLNGIIGSIIQMKPNNELLESLFQGACLLYKMYVANKNRKQFEVYYQIDMLQWEIICYFKNEKQQNLEEIILQLESIYNKIVKNSNIWKYHYLWIQMIGKILIYNPLLTKQKLSYLANSFNFTVTSNQIWKEYQRKGLLIQMDHSPDQAVILLNSLQKQGLFQLDGLILENCFKEWENFLLLKEFLMFEQSQNIPFTFGSYLKCQLNVGSQEPQKNQNILAIENIKKFLGFIIPNKLLSKMKKNYENLGVVVKIYRNCMKDTRQYNERISQSTYNSQIQKMILNLEEYFKNTQYLIKIMKLNFRKNNDQIELIDQNKKIEFNNFFQLKFLLKLLEYVLLFSIQELKVSFDDQQNHTLNQNYKTDPIKILKEQKEFILQEIKNLELKDKKATLVNDLQMKLLALPDDSLDQKNFLEAAQNLIQFIADLKKEVENIEISFLQNNNNLVQMF